MSVYLCRLFKFFLLPFLGILLSFTTYGGYIEDKDGKTIIHVKAWDLPDAKSSAPNAIADYAVLKSFIAKFPEIFKKCYAAKYKANPEKYGHYNWDNVEIKMHKFSGISIEGMGMDSKPLMAIAGGVAPDILYVCFRLSSTYIQNGFLYPLDKPDDGYFTSMTSEERDFCVDSKVWPVIKRKRKQKSSLKHEQ